jgi:predicted HTH domain antitoxin
LWTLDFWVALEHCGFMEIGVPKEIERRLRAKDAALNLALGLYVSKEVTLGQAAETAGISQTQFLEELCKRKIPYHYDLEDLKQDLESVDLLLRDRGL